MDPKNLAFALGYTKCLLKLSKFTQIIELSNVIPFLASSSECWRFLSIAYYKRADYKMANGCCIEALRLDSENKLADKQRKYLKKLGKGNLNDRLTIRYEKKVIDYEPDYFKNSKSNENLVYNILSIDGGGIRDILPALWLSEIEYRTHRPISHLFNMIAGTSTGGIIAAGLSAPVLHDKSYSNIQPVFSASELLDFYRNHAMKLFTVDENQNYFTSFLSSTKYKYTNSGRSALFKERFNKTKLHQSLTELVIPATNEVTPYLFTRYDACNDELKNDSFVDTLMATTATPTFFPPYEIKNKGVFLDGGVHINNPAMTAYHEAIRYNVDIKKVFMLSLGTGSYIPNPSKPDLYREKLFWSQNSYKISEDENEIDRQMYHLLGNCYQRWQVWLEEPIGLDYCKMIPHLLEIGNQYLEELDYSDENPINKLVESFENKNFLLY
ncbi:22353_t:CDS:1 [Dentiscutata erythropus]|uniref:22353_t:CDS:1 n=1 Tax=Dentiscutata erythropus TaxID=1348616 RepID=A0A9N9AC27_9GLOM|nr:22353_t:CDS:1 [Dentiscutata erythropus]